MWTSPAVARFVLAIGGTGSRAQVGAYGVLGKTGTGERSEEIQETLVGPTVPERPVSIRRLSAFDRKFLRALRIQMPS